MTTTYGLQTFRFSILETLHVYTSLLRQPLNRVPVAGTYTDTQRESLVYSCFSSNYEQLCSTSDLSRYNVHVQPHTCTWHLWWNGTPEFIIIHKTPYTIHTCTLYIYACAYTFMYMFISYNIYKCMRTYTHEYTCTYMYVLCTCTCVYMYKELRDTMEALSIGSAE